MRVWCLAAAVAVVAACLPVLPDPAEAECPHRANEENPCSPSRTAPWPMFRRDPQHSGQSSFAGPARPALKWRFETGGQVHATPSIGPDGTVYVTSHGRKLSAVAPDGSERWGLLIGESHTSVAIRADGVLYVASEEAGNLFLYGVNPTGEERWRYGFDDEVHSSPVIAPDGTIYLCGHDGKVHAVGPDGVKRWTVEVGDCHGSPALATDGTVYVGSERTGRFYALRTDGLVSWELEVGGPIESSPAVGADGTIYFGADDGKLYAVSPGGAKKWELQTAGPIISSPAISGGRKGGVGGCAPGVILVGSRDGKLYAVSTDGALQWSYPTGPILFSSPALDGDAIAYIGSSNGKLSAIDCDGTLRWDFATGGRISNSSAAIGSDGTLYIASDDGGLYALGG